MDLRIAQSFTVARYQADPLVRLMLTPRNAPMYSLPWKVKTSSLKNKGGISIKCHLLLKKASILGINNEAFYLVGIACPRVPDHL